MGRKISPKRAGTKTLAFAEGELPFRGKTELVIEYGRDLKLRVQDTGSVMLASELIESLRARNGAARPAKGGA